MGTVVTMEKHQLFPGMPDAGRGGRGLRRREGGDSPGSSVAVVDAIVAAAAELCASGRRTLFLEDDGAALRLRRMARGFAGSVPPATPDSLEICFADCAPDLFAALVERLIRVRPCRYLALAPAPRRLVPEGEARRDWLELLQATVAVDRRWRYRTNASCYFIDLERLAEGAAPGFPRPAPAARPGF